MLNIWRAAAKKAIAEGICTPMVGCGKPMDNAVFRDELSEKESKISGLCQDCQDRLIG